ncbi:MAG: hypothetical protein ACK5NN_00315 [Sphingomonadaceae bacterium]
MITPLPSLSHRFSPPLRDGKWRRRLVLIPRIALLADGRCAILWPGKYLRRWSYRAGGWQWRAR